MGYDTLLIPDHFSAQFAPTSALMAATLATSSLRVGTTIHANDYYHPVVLAKVTASIDIRSDDRRELGIGPGDNKAEYDQIGILFDPPGIQVRRTQEMRERTSISCFSAFLNDVETFARVVARLAGS